MRSAADPPSCCCCSARAGLPAAASSRAAPSRHRLVRRRSSSETALDANVAHDAPSSTSPTKATPILRRAGERREWRAARPALHIEIPQPRLASEQSVGFASPATKSNSTPCSRPTPKTSGSGLRRWWQGLTTPVASGSERLVAGVGRLLKTPKTAVLSARRMLRTAPLSPDEDFLSPSAACEQKMWLHLMLDHDLQTLVELTGNGRLSWFSVALRLDLSRALELNPRHLKIISVQDSEEGKAEIELVITVPLGLEDECQTRLQGLGRGLLDQVQANQDRLATCPTSTDTRATLARDLPTSRAFLISGAGGSLRAQHYNHRSLSGDIEHLGESEEEDDATYLRGGQSLRDFDLRHRPRAQNMCMHICSLKIQVIMCVCVCVCMCMYVCTYTHTNTERQREKERERDTHTHTHTHTRTHAGAR